MPLVASQNLRRACSWVCTSQHTFCRAERKTGEAATSDLAIEQRALIKMEKYGDRQPATQAPDDSDSAKPGAWCEASERMLLACT